MDGNVPEISDDDGIGGKSIKYLILKNWFIKIFSY